jgi:hypothetical protein
VIYRRHTNTSNANAIRPISQKRFHAVSPVITIQMAGKMSAKHAQNRPNPGCPLSDTTIAAIPREFISLSAMRTLH